MTVTGKADPLLSLRARALLYASVVGSMLRSYLDPRRVASLDSDRETGTGMMMQGPSFRVSVAAAVRAMIGKSRWAFVSIADPLVHCHHSVQLNLRK